MAYTVTQLITGAYYASGVVSREFETVSGQQFSDALIFLNDMLGEKVVDDGMIPYETTTTFTGVVGQEDYSIDNCIKIDTLTFEKDNVRYPMTYVKRDQYFGSARAENINSLPNSYYFERGLGGGTLSLYFSPDETYTFTIHGVFRLADVALNDDLELTLDRFYISYLRYQLADRICKEYNYDVPAGVAKQLGDLQDQINKQSRLLDLRLRKRSDLQNNRQTVSWGYVNLGNGWLPY